MFIFLKKRSEQNHFLCSHQHTTFWIKDLVLISWILTLSLVINFFHLPLHFYGIEIERFEFGLIIPFLLIGIVNLKYLLLVVFLLPFADQLLHGHNILLVPFEAIFNFIALFFLAFFKHFFLNKGFFYELSFFFISFFFLLILKFFYFLLIFFIFLPETNLWEFWSKKQNKPFFIFVFLSLPLILSSLRFIIILLVLIFLNRR